MATREEKFKYLPCKVKLITVNKMKELRKGINKITMIPIDQLICDRRSANFTSNIKIALKFISDDVNTYIIDKISYSLICIASFNITKLSIRRSSIFRSTFLSLFLFKKWSAFLPVFQSCKKERGRSSLLAKGSRDLFRVPLIAFV